MKITVAICTWNRAPILDRTLRTLGEAEVPGDVDLKVTVIDNNSDDGTADIARSHAGAIPLEVLFEPKQGIAHARNRAIGAAGGDLLIFLDDDCLVGPDWLVAYIAAARRWPDAAVFGGRIDPVFEVDPPGWIASNIDLLPEVYGMIDRGGQVRPLGPTESVLSGNMALRVSILSRYSFDARLGRVREERTGGEEIDFFLKLMRDRLQGVWVGNARVRHFVPERNINIDYIRRSLYGVGRSEVRLYGCEGRRTVFGVPRWLLRRYLGAGVRSALLSPLRNRGWLEAYRDRVLARGKIDELRSMRRRART